MRVERRVSDSSLVREIDGWSRAREGGLRDELVSVIVRYVLKNPESIAPFQALVFEISRVCSTSFAGFEWAGEVATPTAEDLKAVVLVKFKGVENLQRWIRSPERKAIMRKMTEYVSEMKAEVHDGLVHIVESEKEGDKEKEKKQIQNPPKWKQVCVSIIAVYAVVLPVNYALIFPLAEVGVDLWLNVIVLFVVAIPIVQWFVSPILTKLSRRWLEIPYREYPDGTAFRVLQKGFTWFQNSSQEIRDLERVLLARVSALESKVKYLKTELNLLNNIPVDDEDLKMASAEAHLTLKVIEHEVKEVEESNEQFPVSASISHYVPVSCFKDYEAWLKRAAKKASETVPGFSGTIVVRPREIDDSGIGKYRSIFKYDTHAHLLEWLGSSERKNLLLLVQPFIRNVEVTARRPVPESFDSLFTLQSKQHLSIPVPKWKLAIISSLSLYAPVYINSRYLSPILVGDVGMPRPLSSFITTTINTIVAGYLTAPLFSRMFEDWLKRNPQIPQLQPFKCLHIGFPFFLDKASKKQEKRSIFNRRGDKLQSVSEMKQI
jgi:antibiotic biosynthesis monooxygenase (ABM) superfamily enzyme